MREGIYLVVIDLQATLQRELCLNVLAARSPFFLLKDIYWSWSLCLWQNYKTSRQKYRPRQESSLRSQLYIY